MKKDIKIDRLWESKPHLAFALYFGITMILFFGGMIGFVFLGCPGWLLTFYLIGVCAGCVAVVVFHNEMCNMSKSIAFLKRDQEFYMIKLGYMNQIDYQTPINPLEIAVFGWKTSRDWAVAEQVMREEKGIRKRRENPKNYVRVLNQVLEGKGGVLQGVIDFIVLKNPKVVKETKAFIWISYDSQAGRKTKMFRNAYDLPIQ